MAFQRIVKRWIWDAQGHGRYLHFIIKKNSKTLKCSSWHLKIQSIGEFNNRVQNVMNRF